MKKMMRRITAAMMALACLPVTGLTASAWYGNTTWDAFENLELVGEGAWYYTENAQLYLLQPDNPDSDLVRLVQPNANVIRMVVRDDVDAKAAGRRIAELMDAYFPGFSDGLTEQSATIYDFDRQVYLANTDYGERVFDLSVPDSAVTAELESELLLTLAREHLLASFYGWGETARYDTANFYTLDDYRETRQDITETRGTYADVPIDWETVSVWLMQTHPECAVERYLFATVNERDNDGNITVIEEYHYRITGMEERTVRERIELACELWAEFGILPPIGILESGVESTQGHNALESPGDVTLDCELNLLDAITLNKNLLGVEKLPDTAVKNADVNGDGVPDSADSLAILRELVGLTESFS